MTSILFFGAGASKPFGIPTMQEMVKDFENKLYKEQPDLYDYYLNIKDVLISEYGESKIDIESMFSVIQGISTETSAKDLGHYAYYYMTKKGIPNEIDPSEIEIATELQKELENYIKKTCGYKLHSTQSTEVYKKSYIPLFATISGEKRTYLDKYNLTYDWKAFTTNYDSIFEGFWHSFEEPVDHFDRQGNSNVYVFERKNLSTHSLSKLHGSLDWTKNVENGDVIRRKESSFDTVKTKGNVLLFPIQQKDMYLHPWFTLFQDLKTALLHNDRFYAVGYAFNDPFIFNVFSEALSYGIATLYLINPEAVKIRNKFEEKIRKQIIPLPIKFGDYYFNDDLYEGVNEIRTLNFEIKTDLDQIEFKHESGFLDYQVFETKGFLDPPHVENVPSRSTFEKIKFVSKNTMENHLKFSLEMGYDYNPESKIELRISSSAPSEMDVVITNQDRPIDTFTINQWELSDDAQEYFHDVILDFDTLLCTYLNK